MNIEDNFLQPCDYCCPTELDANGSKAICDDCRKRYETMVRRWAGLHNEEYTTYLSSLSKGIRHVLHDMPRGCGKASLPKPSAETTLEQARKLLATRVKFPK